MSSTTPTNTQLVDANHFQLAGHHLRITYAPFVEAGLPLFSYQDAHQTLTFRGDQIQSVATDAGVVVSVVVKRTVDFGNTTFSVLIPRCRVPFNGSTHCVTEGVTTMHQDAIAPALLRGQLDHYTLVALQGSASHVLF